MDYLLTLTFAAIMIIYILKLKNMDQINSIKIFLKYIFQQLIPSAIYFISKIVQERENLQRMKSPMKW